MTEKTYLTITQLSHYLKKKFDKDPYLQRVFVIGEVSNLRWRPQGHQYFSLKDEQAKIRVTCFKPVADKLGFIPEEGMKVLAIGRVTLYEPSGDYQLVIEHLEIAGAGALYQALKERQRQLAAEGLFDPARKLALPRFPKRIAVLTSPSGAVLHDIQTTIIRRYPIVQLMLYPTIVQGKDSQASIIRQLERVYASEQPFDLIILARGGGSIEDLWSFNEEAVVRCIAKRNVPLISSIGHETDTTLSDLVADVRAATPTAAAEQATPVLREVLQMIQVYEHRLQRAVTTRVQQLEQRFRKTMQSYIFKKPQRLYESYTQKLDRLQERAQHALVRQMNERRYQCDGLHRRLYAANPRERISFSRQQVNQLVHRLNRNAQQVVHNQQQRFAQTLQALDLLSPLKRIGQGYGFLTTAQGPVKSVTQVAVGDSLHIQLADGHIQSEVIAKTEQKGE